MASIHGGPPGSMQMPPGQYINHMATSGGPTMHPAGPMPPQMHPAMRPAMQHPAQAGHMMHPQMSAGPNGMNVHAVSQMQPVPHPNIYNGNPQIAQTFQQGHPGPMFVPNGHGPQLAQAAQMQQQRQMHLAAQQRQQHANQQMMMTSSAGGQQFIHPGQQQQMLKAMQQQGQPIPPQMRHQMEQQQRNMMAQGQIQQGQPIGMQRQPSLQSGSREHPNQAQPPQQHPGQQQSSNIPPHTPQNVQLQRSRPPSNVQAQLPLQQQTPQIQQPQSSHIQQPPEVSQPPNQPALNQPTPQLSNLPSLPGTVAHQQPRGQQMPQNQPNPPQQAGPGLQQNQGNPQQQQAQQQQAVDIDRQRAMRGMQQQRQLQLYQEHQRQLMLASDKLRLFCQAINDLSVSEGRENPDQWQQRVNQTFIPDGTFRIQARHEDGSHIRDFEVSAAVLGRYFAEYFKLGVTRMQVSVGGGNLDNMIGNDEMPSSFAYYFDNGNQVIASGSLKMKFQEGTGKFEHLEFCNVTYEEYVSRNRLELLAVPDQKLSPERTKSTSKQKQAQPRNVPRIVPHDHLPPSPCGEYGIFTEIRNFIERIDVMSRMRPLFQLHQSQPDRTPLEVLDHAVNQPQERNFVQNPQHNMAHQGQAQNMFGNFQHHNMGQQQQLMHQQQHQQQTNGPMRTPAINGLPANAYFQSPAHAHLGLPNHASPHLTGHTPPSGLHTHGGMQAPPMMAQGSHQGMNVSANGSSNASPNVTGKRRRGSLAKGETLDGSEGMGPPPPTQVGQNKVKQSPRPGKKQKGA